GQRERLVRCACAQRGYWNSRGGERRHLEQHIRIWIWIAAAYPVPGRSDAAHHHPVVPYGDQTADLRAMRRRLRPPRRNLHWLPCVGDRRTRTRNEPAPYREYGVAPGRVNGHERNSVGSDNQRTAGRGGCFAVAPPATSVENRTWRERRLG